MSVDTVGRMSQSNITNVDGVSATYVNNTFIRWDGTDTVPGSINMTGNTLTNVSGPVHDHDVAAKNMWIPIWIQSQSMKDLYLWGTIELQIWQIRGIQQMLLIKGMSIHIDVLLVMI